MKAVAEMITGPPCLSGGHCNDRWHTFTPFCLKKKKTTVCWMIVPNSIPCLDLLRSLKLGTLCLRLSMGYPQVKGHYERALSVSDSCPTLCSLSSRTHVTWSPLQSFVLLSSWAQSFLYSAGSQDASSNTMRLNIKSLFYWSMFISGSPTFWP
jgi:hypothetical protein